VLPSPPHRSGSPGSSKRRTATNSSKSCAGRPCHLLIVDEVGYLPLERQAAKLLFALVSRRYERGSIIVTSNRGFEQLAEILGDAMLVAALIDRLVHHATMIVLEGKSYRLRERGTGVAPAAQAPSLRDSA
jgi:DNA replication protein DnaC